MSVDVLHNWVDGWGGRVVGCKEGKKREERLKVMVRREESSIMLFVFERKSKKIRHASQVYGTVTTGWWRRVAWEERGRRSGRRGEWVASEAVA